jgi:ribosomal protein S18 acetylase RimI-like enzyme
MKRFRRLYAEIWERVINGEALIWLAEINGQGLVGQLFVSLDSQRRELADGCARAYVYGFRVQPAYRNYGIGTHLMAAVEADLLERGYRIVTLNVGKDNPGARRLYERLGYRVVAADPGRWSYLDENGIRQEVNEPAWRMEKPLRSEPR